MHQLHSGHEYTQAHTSDRPTGFEQLVLLYIQTSSTHTSSDCLLCTCAMNMYVSGKTTTLVLLAHTQSI